MASVKISALPASGALTGAELVPIVQGGTTDRTTTGAIAALAGGGSSDLIDSLNNAAYFGWALANSNGTQVWGSALSISTVAAGGQSQGVTPGSSSSLRVQSWQYAQTNPAAASYGQVRNTAAGTGVYNGTSGSAVSGAFRVVLVGGWEAVTSPTDLDSARIFIGVSDQTFNTILASQNPSAYPNMVGIGRDDTDTNLQFMCRGTGGVLKVSTGILASTLDSTLLEVGITANAAGTSIVVSLKNKLTGTTISHTFTTSLPNANAEMTSVNSIGTGSVTNALRVFFNRLYYRMGY